MDFLKSTFSPDYDVGDQFHADIVKEEEEIQNEQKKQYEYDTIIRDSYITISSNKRNKKAHPNTNSYVIEFVNPIMNIISMEIIKYNFPVQTYVITHNNDTFAFSETLYDNSGNMKSTETFQLRIPIGHYDSIHNLLSILEDTINEEYASSMNMPSGKYYSVELCQNDTRINIYPKVQELVQFQLLLSIQNSIGHTLGFGNVDSHPSSMYTDEKVFELQYETSSLYVMHLLTQNAIHDSVQLYKNGYVFMKNASKEYTITGIANVFEENDEIHQTQSDSVSPFLNNADIHTIQFIESYDISQSKILYTDFTKDNSDYDMLFIQSPPDNELQSDTQLILYCNDFDTGKTLIHIRVKPQQYYSPGSAPESQWFQILDSYSYRIPKHTPHTQYSIYDSANRFQVEENAQSYAQFQDYSRLGISYIRCGFSNLTTVSTSDIKILVYMHESSWSHDFIMLNSTDPQLNMLFLEVDGTAVEMNIRKCDQNTHYSTSRYMILHSESKHSTLQDSVHTLLSSQCDTYENYISQASLDFQSAYADLSSFTPHKTKVIWASTDRTQFLYQSLFDESADEVILHTPVDSYGSELSNSLLILHSEQTLPEYGFIHFYIDGAIHVLYVENVSTDDQLQPYLPPHTHTLKIISAVNEYIASTLGNMNTIWDFIDSIQDHTPFVVTDKCVDGHILVKDHVAEWSMDVYSIRNASSQNNIFIPVQENTSLVYSDNYFCKFSSPNHNSPIYFKSDLQTIQMTRTVFTTQDVNYNTYLFENDLTSLSLNVVDAKVKYENGIVSQYAYDMSPDNVIHVHTKELDYIHESNLGVVYGGTSEVLSNNNRVFHPIKKLPRLSLTFTYADDKTLYDFDNKEHSFVLKISHKNKSVKKFDESTLH